MARDKLLPACSPRRRHGWGGSGSALLLTQSRTKASERAFSAVADNGDTHRKEFGYGKRKRLKFRYDKLMSLKKRRVLPAFYSSTQYTLISFHPHLAVIHIKLVPYFIYGIR